ncbi:BLUF domain-containing protein [Poseidonibacter ostreae]|uniref:BLUF domain-containing protein n=1 Tax=Poseidonibacter ostreae TaxID=2654171 RepID=UPI00186B026A|nr:BLUF domain-containing protein [Poseidonibacter ostreae]
MFRIMYMSTATRVIPDSELEELLETSRKNNKEKNLTGLLIVKGRTFLQCLEGEKKDVEEVFNKILKDDRHTSIIDLIEEDISSRMFPTWDMGYKNLKIVEDIKSEKIRKISSLDDFDIKKEDIAEVIQEFIAYD